MSAHTPGPWHWAETLQGYDLVESQPGLPAIASCTSVKEQDARLIAAAPDLLEALKDLLQPVSDDEINECPQYAQARDAVARAEGNL